MVTGGHMPSFDAELIAAVRFHALGESPNHPLQSVMWPRSLLYTCGGQSWARTIS
jgi:hypothetical protein